MTFINTIESSWLFLFRSTNVSDANLIDEYTKHPFVKRQMKKDTSIKEPTPKKTDPPNLRYVNGVPVLSSIDVTGWDAIGAENAGENAELSKNHNG